MNCSIWAGSTLEETEIKKESESSNLQLYKVLLCLLLIINTGCVNSLFEPEEFRVTAGPPRNIVQNSLPLNLVWSQPLTNGLPNVKLPIACFQDRGVVLSWLPDQEDWQGTALFDERGNVLWNHPEDTANAVSLDEDAVYIFDAPKLRAYQIDSGKLLWETQEGLGYRLSAYLFVEGDELHFVSDDKFNVYQKNNGQMLSEEIAPGRNLVLRHNGLDLHSDGNLYATAVGEPQNVLWVSEAYASRLYLPQIYEDSLLVQSPVPGNNNVCRVSIIDGRVIWCENKHLLSNIATYNGIGYAVNQQDELIGFRLEDGIEVGKIVFRPEGTHETKLYYHITACEDHLLVYLASPEELFWFNFIE